MLFSLLLFLKAPHNQSFKPIKFFLLSKSSCLLRDRNADLAGHTCRLLLKARSNELTSIVVFRCSLTPFFREISGLFTVHGRVNSNLTAVLPKSIHLDDSIEMAFDNHRCFSPCLLEQLQGYIFLFLCFQIVISEIFQGRR